MNLKDIKKEIERCAQIVEWSPTDTEIQRISEVLAKKHSLGHELSKNDLLDIVQEIIGPVLVMLNEGIDNTDLKTLLKLCTKPNNNDE
ncbi:hypothetical protein GCM10011332_33180 [Terasakiella brassicae]|uniref:Uncharacterized protein n=1 Tax=Terasakiella brassicae TaxID=1634917 RepID=A0A917FER2_9PROT|nr:hypothetical protein [Terasakiella brassicae]GGF76544.1 hypothetical protein GCM10011332_33180 [Terasakiella brassicae]